MPEHRRSIIHAKFASKLAPTERRVLPVFVGASLLAINCRTAAPRTTSPTSLLGAQFRRHGAAVFGELVHDGAMQPGIHLCRIRHFVLRATQLGGKLFTRLQTAI